MTNNPTTLGAGMSDDERRRIDRECNPRTLPGMSDNQTDSSLPTEQPTAEQPYDRRIAEGIRYAVSALNTAIDVAQEAGIQVHFGVTVWTGLRPQKSHVDNLRIERPADWRHDYPGEKL